MNNDSSPRLQDYKTRRQDALMMIASGVVVLLVAIGAAWVACGLFGAGMVLIGGAGIFLALLGYDLLEDLRSRRHLL